MKKIVSIVIVTISWLNCFSKNDPVAIRFVPMFGNEKLVQEKKYFLQNHNDSISIDQFRFYVTNIRFVKSGKVIYREKKSFHLIDIGNKLEILIHPTKKINFDEVIFDIGVDSLTNISGAHGGDLDPLHGMYWAWQSGYINMKLEGTSTGCNTRNNRFQYHMGGYAGENATLQTVSFSTSGNTSINISIQLEKLLTEINILNVCEVMSPGKNSVLISELFKTVFSLYK